LEDILEANRLSALVGTVMRLESEMIHVLRLFVSLIPPSQKRQLKIPEIPNQSELKEEAKKIGGNVLWDKFNKIKEEYDNKSSELAEYLEEKEFEIDAFENQLSESQILWIRSHLVEIKARLKGIES
jgi:hypothetical protein